MLKQLLSVFLQSSCPFCQRSTSKTICPYCFQKLLTYQFQAGDRLRWQGNLPLFALGRYDGELKRAILLMKYENHPEIGAILGELISTAWSESKFIKPAKISVIPIPLHPSKIKTRGFNQAEKIARSFCHFSGYRLCPQALTRQRETQAMYSLNPEERIKNIQGAFCLGRNLPSYPVLLLDDIHTTGTTVNECARVLRQNKIEVIGSIVVAQTG